MSAKRDEMRKKVQKLYALANNKGATESEVKSALLMAQKIMVKYHLEEKDVLGSPEEQKGVTRCYVFSGNRKKMNYYLYLAAVIQENFRVKVLNSPTSVNFFGAEDDAEVALNTYTYCIERMDLLAKDFLKQHKLDMKALGVSVTSSDMKRTKYSYMQGFVFGVAEAFENQKEELKKELSAEEFSLTVIGLPEEVQKQWDLMTSGSKSKKINHKKCEDLDMTAYFKGHKDGETLLDNDRLDVSFS